MNKEQAYQLAQAGREIDADLYKTRRLIRDLAIFTRGAGAGRAADHLEDAAHELRHALEHIKQMVGGVQMAWEEESHGETEISKQGSQSLGSGIPMEESHGEARDTEGGERP